MNFCIPFEFEIYDSWYLLILSPEDFSTKKFPPSKTILVERN